MNKVYIIFDCSGSMAESGHNAVLKSAFLAVRRSFPRILMYIWNEELRSIEKAKEIVAKGKANAEVLFHFLENLEEHPAILLVSDGCWSAKDAEKISLATAKYDVYSCAVGQETNLANLKKAQTIGKKPFRMVDFPTVIEYLLRK